MMFNIFIQGLFLQATLILALGAQNIFVLNSGLRRERHLLVAFVSSVCDTFLIFIGVLGVATIFIKFSILKIGLGFVGVVFLFYYGILKLREAKNDFEVSQESSPAITTKQVVLTSMGFSLLNPHVYLDTVILVGGYSAKFALISERFLFGLGASLFSTIWFFSLAHLSSLSSRLLNNPKAMRIISLISGLILIFLSIKLGAEVFGWIKEFLIVT